MARSDMTADTPVDHQVSTQQLRDAFARLPAGVTVLTTYASGEPCGMTASAVCSLSLDPPLALVAVANTSRTLARIRTHRAFGVNVLGAGQAPLAERFARSADSPGERFTGLAYDRIAAVPILRGAIAWVACEVRHTYPGGDHTILTGLVRSAGHTSGAPLIWHERGFTAL
ncbi:flavin reductase family protein [Streptomyces poonensis]|uniref:Oxidoreductase n=1 Tax=Streptomyces poonensis TaxID=68255 RepID=A0A918Q1B0_9ACTN|nr:flavin reductase family protein [Streptomyces poonensis]GGZ29699.1 oxidoreductase [Streptomyces poonensis]